MEEKWDLWVMPDVLGFYANKIITTGEGGMVVFKDKNLPKKPRI